MRLQNLINRRNGLFFTDFHKWALTLMQKTPINSKAEGKNVVSDLTNTLKLSLTLFPCRNYSFSVWIYSFVWLYFIIRVTKFACIKLFDDVTCLLHLQKLRITECVVFNVKRVCAFVIERYNSKFVGTSH